jgi:16S rRNA (adenine1518-N6/adenine1519-N6)-dimethyltransferase
VNLTSPSQVKSWCIENGFHPNRTLGQNFLIDRNVLDAIIAAAGVCKGQRVLEIGPGLGVLTEALLEVGASVVAVEKDSRLASRLSEALGHPKQLTMVQADALDLDLDELLRDKESDEAGFDACISNLPYSVGTRILLDYARHPLAPSRFIVLVQAEVAERFVAGPDEEARGQAGVWLQLGYHVKRIREVKASCFWPRPEVSSTVVRLDRQPVLLTADEHRWFELLTREAFMHRRKQLGAIFRKAPPPIIHSDEVLALLFSQAGVDAQARPEKLTNDEWKRLAKSFCKGISP